MEFRILGPLEALADGRALAIPSGQQRTLLALLVVNANRVLSPDRIVDEVWGGRLPATGTKALAFHVSRLRDALAPGRRPGTPAGGLETEAGGYVLRVDPGAIDAVRFERLAREAHGRLADEPAVAHSMLVEALALWRGDALVDVAYAEFAQAEIRRLDELRLGALEDRLEAELALGEHLAAIGELESLLDANPLRERLRGLLMLALYRSGRQAEALRVAGTGRRLLSEELGIDPSPELVRLEARILAQDPELDLPTPLAAATTGPARNPYKGLRAFGEADSADFFGRDALVGRLVARLEEVAHADRLLAVVGPSGSGKSSVVRAGLIPALRAGVAADGGPWRIATMVPGVAPFRELAAALAASGQPIAGATVDRVARGGRALHRAVAGEHVRAVVARRPFGSALPAGDGHGGLADRQGLQPICHRCRVCR
jgi:DNA-binding SARP family transcriptional activator